MWWALAAAAVPYVAQALQSEPWQPSRPPPVLPPDRSYQNQLLLDNAFNPHSELFARASDTVQENINRALAKSGMSGSSGGMATSANTQGTLAAKWLEEQSSRQRMALDAVNGNDLRRTEMLNDINNQQYQYDAARYNRTNAENASQVAMYGGLAHGLTDAYGQYRSQQDRDHVSSAIANYYNTHQGWHPPTTGVPDSTGYVDYSNPDPYYSTRAGTAYLTPGGY